MANEFIARKGLIVSGSTTITGSAIVSGSVTASFFSGDGSQLTNVTVESSTVTVDAYYFTSSGAQTEFLLDAQYNINSLFVVVDGLSFNAATDYIISSSTVVFTSAPPSESIIAITALVNVTENATGSFFGSFIGNGAGLTDIRTALAIDTHQFVGNGSTFEYVLSQSYTPNSLLVSVEGINYGLNTDFTVSSSTLTFVEAPPSQSNIIVNAFISVSSGSIGTFSGSFIGDGSGLTGISGGGDSFPYTGSAIISGSLQVTGSVTATSFVGDGSGLTGISGGGDSFPYTGSAIISGSLQVTGSVTATSFIGDGSGLTGLPTSSVTIGASAADVLSAAAGEITADDAGSDKIVFWDDSESKLTYLAVGDNLEISGSTLNVTTTEDWYVVAASDETTNLTTATGSVYFRMPYAGTLLEVRATVNTAPSGSTLIADINKNGSSILGTKLSIDAAEKTSETAASGATISDSALADDDEISIDIDQVGSTIAGKGLKVYLKIRRSIISTSEDWYVVAASDETDNLTTATGAVYFRMPYAGTLLDVRSSVNTAPSGSTLIVDINESGTSVLSTKLSIDATEKTSTTAAVPPVISDSALADDAEMSIDIDQVGSTIAGKGLKVYLKIRRN